MDARKRAENLRDAVSALRIAGQSMSNVCFNLGQGAQPIDPRHIPTLAECARAWDKADAFAREALKPHPRAPRRAQKGPR